MLLCAKFYFQIESMWMCAWVRCRLSGLLWNPENCSRQCADYYLYTNIEYKSRYKMLKTIEITSVNRKKTLILLIFCGLFLYAVNVDVELSIKKSDSANFFLAKTGFGVLCTRHKFAISYWIFLIFRHFIFYQSF